MTDILLIEPVVESKAKVMRIIGSIGTLKAKVKYPPADLAILGGLLRKNGVDFKIVDALNTDMTWKQLSGLIKKEDPKCVVFTCTIPSLNNDVRTATIAKEVDSSIKTIAINFLMESSTYSILDRYKDLDYVCVRDYEFPVLNLIQSGFDSANVKGIYYRDTSGKSVKNEGGDYCMNLDDLGIPAHDMLPLHIYEDFIIRRKPMTIVIMSRGCVNEGSCHHCCSKYLQPYRMRSVESVIEEMKFLQEIGVKEIAFWDSEIPLERNNTPQTWTRKLFERMAEEKFDFSMAGNARSDCTNPELLGKMKKLGFHTIKLGADSIHQHILDNMHKDESVKETEKAVKDIKAAKLKLLTYCTLGHKGETAQTMKDTIDWIINKLDPNYTTFSLVVPVKGTVFYDYLKDSGYLIENLEGDPNDPPAFNYTGRMEREGLPDMSNQEMYQIAMNGYKKFYLRPSYVVKRMMNTKDLWFDFKNGLYFVSRYVLEPMSKGKGK